MKEQINELEQLLIPIKTDINRLILRAVENLNSKIKPILDEYEVKIKLSFYREDPDEITYLLLHAVDQDKVKDSDKKMKLSKEIDNFNTDLMRAYKMGIFPKLFVQMGHTELSVEQIFLVSYESDTVSKQVIEENVKKVLATPEIIEGKGLEI